MDDERARSIAEELCRMGIREGLNKVNDEEGGMID